MRLEIGIGKNLFNVLIYFSLITENTSANKIIFYYLLFLPFILDMDKQ